MYIFSNKETGWKFVFAFVGKAASHMGHESLPPSQLDALSPSLVTRCCAQQPTSKEASSWTQHRLPEGEPAQRMALAETKLLRHILLLIKTRAPIQT